MKENKEEKPQTLAKAFDLYQKGEAEQPVVYKRAGAIKSEHDVYKVILTKEMVDRDGEIVAVNGMQLPSNGVPLIDGHNMNGSVIDNRLGTVKNIQALGDQVVGDVIFVDTMRGREAKAIADDPAHFLSVSMGFGVKEFDPSTNTIKEWELYELSVVNVPANVGARFIKGFELDEEIKEVEKQLSRLKTIEPAFKEIRATFLSDWFCKEIGYEKKGELNLDIASIYELVCNKFKEPQVETPQVQEQKTSEQTTYKFSSQDIASLANSIVNKIV